MNLQEFKNAYAQAKKGQFTIAKWQNVKKVNDIECKKVSRGVVRLVQYSHIKGVVVKGKINVNEECLIPSTLYYNHHTNNYLVHLGTTKVRTLCAYYLNGEEVSKEEYEKLIPPSPNATERPIFNVKLENLLEFGN